MKTLRQLKHLTLALLLLAPFGVAWADWELDSADSRINFVSVKNNAVAEVHGFATLVGYITTDGKARCGRRRRRTPTTISD